MLRFAARLVVALLLVPAARAQTPAAPAVALPADSPRWELEGQAKAADHLGRRATPSISL